MYIFKSVSLRKFFYNTLRQPFFCFRIIHVL